MKRNIYFCQFNFMYGRDVFIPYSVGMLWSYARTIPEIENNYHNAGFVFIRKDPDTIAESFHNPDIVAFSAYVWNWEMNIEVARRVKERFPNCLIVFGGPQVPDRMDGFFEKHPFIDIAVHGEGELTFSQILLSRLRGKKFDIKGISLNKMGREAFPWKQQDRFTDINLIPSPYLTGVFNDVIREPYVFQPIWETNRGCPYQCTFCDWGSLTYSKVRRFDMDRLFGEINWFGDNKLGFIFGADANFGILERDMELAQALVDKKALTGGYPEKFRVSFAKNSTNRVLIIAEILNAHKMDKGITLSVQSMDEVTLKAIKRANLKIESLSHFVREYQRKDIPTYTELILGLPGETYESFKEGIEKLLVAGVHDSLAIYNCTVLPNTELNNPTYRALHEIVTIRTPIFLNHSIPGLDPVQEYEEVVIGTKNLSTDDWKRQYVFAWIVQTCQTLNLTQVITVFFNVQMNLRYADFYEEFLLFARENPESLIGEELRFVDSMLNEVLSGGSWDIVLDEFSEISWSTDEASYLRLSKNLDQFYDELDDFLESLVEKNNLSLDENLRKDILRYQQALVVKWQKSGTQELELNYSLHSFTKSALNGDFAELQKGHYLVAINDPFQFSGNKRRYAREIIWWGRKGGKFVYQDVHEQTRGNEGVDLPPPHIPVMVKFADTTPASNEDNDDQHDKVNV